MNLVISPNPTRGFLQLDQQITGQLSVYNTIGELVYERFLEEDQTINLEQLNNGIYFLQIQTTEGWMREKLVLQK